MISLSAESLNGKKFRSLIEYALNNTDSISFVINNGYDLMGYRNSLPFEISELNSTECYPVFIHPITGSSFDDSKMVVLESDKTLKSFFLKANSFEDFNGVLFPEELCFFRKGCVWLEYISHENLLFIVGETNEDIVFLKKNEIHYYHCGT